MADGDASTAFLPGIEGVTKFVHNLSTKIAPTKNNVRTTIHTRAAIIPLLPHATVTVNSVPTITRARVIRDKPPRTTTALTPIASLAAYTPISNTESVVYPLCDTNLDCNKNHFCAFKCWTGGCGLDLKVKIHTRGGYCQPCRACKSIKGFVPRNCKVCMVGVTRDSRSTIYTAGPVSKAATTDSTPYTCAPEGDTTTASYQDDQTKYGGKYILVY